MVLLNDELTQTLKQQLNPHTHTHTHTQTNTHTHTHRARARTRTRTRTRAHTHTHTQNTHNAPETILQHPENFTQFAKNLEPPASCPLQIQYLKPLEPQSPRHSTRPLKIISPTTREKKSFQTQMPKGLKPPEAHSDHRIDPQPPKLGPT